MAHALTAPRDIEFRTMKPSRERERECAFPLFVPTKNALLVL
ncbi:hypothetical protein ACE10Z_26275 [Bradyrhizobium sp. Pha-3]